jgi:membrane protein YdbS with pleckstrin-like domain
MEDREIVEHLKTIPLFQDLTDERGELELYHVAPIVQEKSYGIGDWIFNQGQPSTGLYLVLEGKLRLTRVDRDGITRHLKDIGPGAVLGETGLLVGDVHDATAEALTPTRLLYIDRDEFAKILERRPRLRRNLNMSEDVARRRSVPRLDWMRDDEWVVFSVKRHWAYLLRKILPPSVLFLIFSPLFYFLMISGSPARWVFGPLLGVFLVILFLLLVYQYVDWENDFFVLTTQRIVHIENIWPIKQDFEESTIENIEDIYELRPTFAANVLDFGNLILQTAGETVQIDMVGMPNPSRLRELIFHEIQRNRALGVLRSRGEIREVLQQRLSLEPPPPMPEPEPTKTKDSSVAILVLQAIKEYFFPPTWAASEGGDTIVWRRFWLPGFFRYLRIFIPLAILTVGGAWGLTQVWATESLHWLLGVWLLLEAILFGWLLWFIEDWRNDYFEITPNRIILVFQQPLLLQESRREAPLDRIQNISFEVPGILANIFKYGHVMLETAGTTGKFELKWVHRPQKIQAEISRRQQEYSRQQRAIDAKRRQDEMLSWFATYDTMRRTSQLPDAQP